ncbi:peptidase S8 [Clostridium botulinum]|uniref:S8 family peptidase n=1 Tax=Clostridium botulinum TaxID=1491 RepID=UPI00137580EC|nr:S8 family serine peptidase [Clostridium botulinum]MCC5418043.1 S8 family serine peptidase [Clostridium botulinum]NCI19022.1 S8 family serine peptidase [Clostridium botulinum]NCI38033.1 S8 family serine peptidase [Clostridium botulinum]NCI75045.1 S8 family serine peptidase [Clostridium botulinum]NDI38080.1 S8 family serine peptidase [Clostridium botulinum]
MIKKLNFKKICLLLLSIFMFSIIFQSSKVQAIETNKNKDINIVVLFNNNRIDTNVKNLIENSGGKIKNILSEVGCMEVKCNSNLISQIKSYNTVKSLGPNHNIQIPKEKTIKFKERINRGYKSAENNEDGDLYDLYQWDIKRMTNNGKSFQLSTGNHDVVIAILDSGIDKDHPDLRNNLLGGENFIPKDFNNDKTETGDLRDIEDRLGHGTCISGSIAGNGRIKGIAPNIGFKSYRVFDSKGDTNATIMSSAIIKATDDGANVINLSMAGYDLKGKCYWTDPDTGVKHDLGDDMAEYELYKRAIQYALNHNVTVVTAAGNDGLDCCDTKSLTEFLNNRDREDGFSYEGVTYEIPGSIDGVINVSATGRSDKIATYSNYGKNFIGVAAPGGDHPKTESLDIDDMCLSTAIGGQYRFEAGTSIAAPKVSAIAGLLLCKNKNLTPKEVAEKIYKTCDILDNDESKQYYGSGLANAYNALEKNK